MLHPKTPTLHQPLHSKVANYLNSQRRTGQFCDLIIDLEAGDIENEVLFGHFCVIGAQSNFIGGSPFLQKSLSFSIHHPLKITLKNFSCTHCLRTMMDFFYEDVVSIVTAHEPHFRKLSRILAVTELLKLFEINKDPSTNDESDQAEGDETSDKDEKNIQPGNIFDGQQNYFKLTNPRAANSSSSKINYCIGCDFKSYRVNEMIAHMSSCEDSNLTCSLCEIGFVEWREYEAHLRKHSEDRKKPFICLVCDGRFMTRAALTIHHPKHTTEAPHLCPDCGKSFKWKQGLKSHLLIHNNEKLMLCDICGFSTTHMKALKSHKLRHNGEFFKCTHPGCTHRANRKENLKLHIETHKQDKPFVCEICGCKFSQNKNLKRHSLKHSTSTDIRKYQCQLCEFWSHRSDKLKEHMQRVHTEKAVQLELPEIVENAFECKEEDVFKLPVVPILKTSCRATEMISKEHHQTKSTARKKRRQKIVVAQNRLHPLIAKIPD